MKKLLTIVLMAIGLYTNAQVTTVSLQASGLTCSMCSKAVQMALEEVSFVENVQVDIKNQQYNLTFKEGQTVNLDALNKAVQDAGFSVAAMKVTAALKKEILQKDAHLKLGEQTFHFLNAANQTVEGEVTFSIVDKGFVSSKEYKKYAGMTKMACVQTGRMAKCCAASDVVADGRVYHAII